MKKTLISMAVAMASISYVQAGTVTTEGPDLILSTDGGFKVKTSDKKASFQVGGRIQYDYNYSEKNGKNDESDFDVRRARLFVKGHLGEWAYKSQFNLGENGDSSSGTVEDLYIQYKGWGDAAKLTVGRAKEPFGLEQLTSSKDISVLERSALTERFTPGRNEGLQLSGKNGQFNYAAGIYEGGSVGDGKGDDEARQLAFTGRVVFAPVTEKGNVVHFGLAYTDRGNNSELESALGFEAAAVMGAFHVQTEYFNGDTLSEGGIDGYYLQAGWIVTGESRPYKDGKFKRVKPMAASGAWEVVARYETGDGDFGDVELSETDASAYTVGLNWYATNNARLGVNYTVGDSEVNSDDGNELRARIQYVF
tara:strand:+ start:2991 stop:4085 length:1095 start_codon:yes stop_codon:yes gene_type:complete